MRGMQALGDMEIVSTGLLVIFCLRHIHIRQTLLNIVSQAIVFTFFCYCFSSYLFSPFIFSHLSTLYCYPYIFSDMASNTPLKQLSVIAGNKGLSDLHIPTITEDAEDVVGTFIGKKSTLSIAFPNLWAGTITIYRHARLEQDFHQISAICEYGSLMLFCRAHPTSKGRSSHNQPMDGQTT